MLDRTSCCFRDGRLYKSDDGCNVPGCLARADGVPGCSEADVNANDDADWKVQNDTHLHPRGATWEEDLPRAASSNSWTETREERATEKTWVTSDLCSWSLLQD